MMHYGMLIWPRHREVLLSHVCVHAQLLREKGVRDQHSGQQQKGLMPSAPGDPDFKARALSLDMPQWQPNYGKKVYNVAMMCDSNNVLWLAQDPPRREGGLLSSVIHKLEQQFVVCSRISLATLMESLQGDLRQLRGL